MTNIQVTEIKPQLIHLDFDHNTRMNKCLIRFQEYAENPKFKGVHNFSVSAIKRYYKSASGNGAFDYYRRVLGCNIPSASFEAFYNGAFDQLNSYEKEILDLIPQYINRNNKYYIIATADKKAKKESLKAMEHEIAHGLWFIDHSYHSKCMVILNESKMLERFRSVIAKMGYHNSVWYDEIHAYVSTDNDSQFVRRFRLHSEADKVEAFKTRNELKKVFEEHYKK